MNEVYQLNAIEHELVSLGWKVARDVDPSWVDLPGDLPILDFYAVRKADGDAADSERLIIEVPNRRRERDWVDVRERVHWLIADEEEAMRRLDAIADGLDGAGDHRTALQVRFLDVSADQAQARRLRKFSVRSDDALRSELVAANNFLEAAAPGQRSLSIAITWSRWVRILGIRFPAKLRRQLIDADIRTIQKDLYDAGIVETPPEEYYLTHQSLMALVEGGDIEWSKLASLEADLRRVLTHIARQLGKADAFEVDKAPPRGRQGVELFDHLETLLVNGLGRDGAGRFSAYLARLRSTDGTPAYRQALIDFERATEAVGFVIDLLPGLRDLTDTIAD